MVGQIDSDIVKQRAAVIVGKFFSSLTGEITVLKQDVN